MAKTKDVRHFKDPLVNNYECSNFFPTQTLVDVDKDTNFIIKKEEERQARKLIFIASESLVPRPVREVLASVFTNIYSEGYPSHRMNKTERKLLLDFNKSNITRDYIVFSLLLELKSSVKHAIYNVIQKHPSIIC